MFSLPVGWIPGSGQILSWMCLEMQLGSGEDELLDVEWQGLFMLSE